MDDQNKLKTPRRLYLSETQAVPRVARNVRTYGGVESRSDWGAVNVPRAATILGEKSAPLGCQLEHQIRK